MSRAKRVRLMLAACFPLGALGHFWWVGRHGLLYHGPAPGWAVWFWYGLCVIDFLVCAVLIARPQAGLILAVATMVVSLVVNWTCFPTFQHGPNPVLLGLTAFGLTLFALTPWLWRATACVVRVGPR